MYNIAFDYENVFYVSKFKNTELKPSGANWKLVKSIFNSSSSKCK